MIAVRPLSAGEGERRIDELTALLIDVVDRGASVGFLAPLEDRIARSFWRRMLDDVARGELVLLAAFDDDRLVGTIQLFPAAAPNSPHRAVVRKLLVHGEARRRGIGRALIAALEAEALARGRTLLELDTKVGDPAEALYLHLGWTRVGEIPRYVLSSAGGLDATAIFYKELAASGG